MAPKEFSILVEYPGGSFNPVVTSAMTVGQLFEIVTKFLLIRETWYFALRLVNGANTKILKLKEKISAVLKSADSHAKIQFGILLYPEDTSDLIEDVTKALFYHEVQDLILQEKIYCPPETAVVLASYQAVVSHGKFDPSIHKPGYLKISEYLPPHIRETHNFTEAQWEQRISDLHKGHGEMHVEDAILEYLNSAQELDMYGVFHFAVKNKRNTSAWLGVTAAGLFLYDYENKLLPKIHFQWGEIRHMANSRSKLIIKPKDLSASNAVFMCESQPECKEVLALCTRYVDFQRMMQRSTQSMEIKLMRAAAEKLRLTRQSERERLEAERNAREDAQKQLLTMQRVLQQQEEEFEKSQQRLAILQQRIQDLEDQLEHERQLRQTLQETQLKLQEYNQKLESESLSSQEERDKMVAERDMIAAEVQRQEQLIREQEAEKLRLEELVNEAKALQAAAATNEKPDVEEKADLYMGDLAVKEELRDVKANMDTDYAVKLQFLKQELDSAKIQNNLHEVDVQHEINRAQGRDKFKTLRQLRCGNTRARVDLFECL